MGLKLGETKLLFIVFVLFVCANRVVLCVACLGVRFCAVSPSLCLDII